MEMYHIVECSVKRKLVLRSILDLRNELGFIYHYIPETDVGDFECISFILNGTVNPVKVR